MGNRDHRYGMCVYLRVAALCLVVACAAPGYSQLSPGEHTAHHGGQRQAGAGASQPAGSGEVGETREGTGEMMREMGTPRRKELYPSLMELPELPPEQRAEVEHLAHERMEAGTALLSASLEKLAKATAAEDYAAMQEATAQVRQGLAQFESGLAAHRALAEGKGTREVALQWFKRTMNLLPAVEVETPHGIFGLSWFHYVTMFILTAFAVTMIWMYFHKMRRAEALLVKLAGGTGSVGDEATTGPSSPPSPGRVSPAPPASGPGLSPTPAPVHPAIAPSKSNSWSGPLRVARIFQETPHVKTFRLTDPSGGTLPFSYLPGQFLTFTVTPDGQPVKRSYTIASSPTHRDACEVTVRREEQGVVSRYLHERVHEGALLQLTAPSGKFTFTGQEADSIVLIAGGVGVTPFMSTIRYLTDRSWPGDIFLMYGCHEENDVIFREELEYLRRRYPNLHVTITATQADPSTWPYATGRITKELLAQSVPELASHRVHICGPPPMMDAVKGMLAELGVPAERIQTETFIGKERPQAPPAVPDGAAPLKTAVVTFVRSHKTAVLPPNKTILEASEDVGVNLDYSCRVGICGVCRVKLLAGAVTMAVEDGLEPGDKAQNIILACQAKATSDVAVDV